MSGEELITLAEQEQRQKEIRIKDMIFGLLDCGMTLLLFLPFFAQNTNGTIQAVSLLALTTIRPYLKFLYFAVVIGSIILGLLTLVLQNKAGAVWGTSKIALSLILGAVGVVAFIVRRQPYAAAFVFMFLGIKALMLIKLK